MRILTPALLVSLALLEVAPAHGADSLLAFSDPKPQHYELSARASVIVEDTGRRVDYDYDVLYRLMGESITDSTAGNFSSRFYRVESR